MVGHGLAKGASAMGLVLWCGLCAGQTQELVYRNVSSEKLEKVVYPPHTPTITN